MTLSHLQRRRRLARPIVANAVGCALLVISIFTAPFLVALGLAALVASLANRCHALVTPRRRRSQTAPH